MAFVPYFIKLKSWWNEHTSYFIAITYYIVPPMYVWSTVTWASRECLSQEVCGGLDECYTFYLKADYESCCKIRAFSIFGKAWSVIAYQRTIERAGNVPEWPRS